MSPRVGRQLHLRVVRQGPVFYAGREPQELPQPLRRAPAGHVGGDTVADIEDPSAVINLAADGLEIVAAGGEGAFGDASTGDVGIGGRVGGGAGEDEKEEEDESFHGDCVCSSVGLNRSRGLDMGT